MVIRHCFKSKEMINLSQNRGILHMKGGIRTTWQLIREKLSIDILNYDSYFEQEYPLSINLSPCL